MRYSAFLAALLATTVVTNAQFPHVNSKVEKKQIAIRSAVILPPQVSFAKVSAKGGEGGIPQAEQIAESFYKAVASELSARGVTILPNPAELANDDKARFAISDLESKYDNIAVQIRRKLSRVDKGGYTLGDKVASFEPARNADVLVFLRGSGTKPTAGRNAISLATSPLNIGPYFRAEFAMVDAKTGEVLVYFRFSRRKDMTKDGEDRFADSLHDWLGPVPLPTPAAKK